MAKRLDRREFMLGAGLEVAALTDHAIIGKDHGDVTCPSQSRARCSSG